MTDLRLRYTIDGSGKTLSVESPDGWQTLAAISLDATRSSPEAEAAWRTLLADAIEARAVSAEGST